jgi:hypothetical protein
MEVFMNLTALKRTITTITFGLITILGTSVIANAQYSNRDYREMRKREQRIEKQQRKLERQQQRYNNRYRVYRNGNYYETDERGAQALRQAVNYGYQQGFRAGQYDRSRRNRYGYNSQNMYRQGTYGYQTYVDRSQYQYYFQQGFQRGYEDGYYSRNQYGSSGNNILGSILSTILNLSQY